MLKWIIALCIAISANLSAEVKVLAFAGSTREASVNKKLVVEAADMARQKGAEVTVIDLKDYPLPFCDGDIELMPQNAIELRQLMIQSDVILIASPDFNGSVSGLLKNTIDWTTRSEKGGSSREAYKGKIFSIMSASPSLSGGAKGLVHLRKIIENIGGNVIPAQVSVPDAYNAFDDSGCLINDKLRAELFELISQAVPGK